ncbi:MAG: RNase H-like domain-containing protein [Gammaproteobacteria bacterium]|nr:RNase H-like domain-containing protein [Gammaproteobacteria bacterium]
MGTINGNSCEITVDTGSNISIVRPDLLSGVNPDLIQPVHSCIRTVTGERAPIHGKGQVELGIGPLVIPQELWVADIQDQCILGLDFLHPNECQVNLRDQLLTIGKHEIPLKRSSSVSTDQACLKAVLVQEVCLQPLSETVVSVKVDGAQSYTVGMLEQVEIPPHLDGLLVARTLVDLSKGSIPMRVLNLSHQQRIVRKGTQLASCDTVSSIVASSSPAAGRFSGDVQKTATMEKLPPHLRDLFARSVEGLTETECQDVCQLLTEFSDVFSAGPHDLGCTDLIKHHIDTGLSMPVRQPPRRLPLTKREDAERSICEMQEMDVIEPSSSPWSSPIVLVQKKDGTSRFCVDYRRLNDITHKDSYPLPRIDDTIEALSGVEWFSTLDLRSGYWQVPLDESSKEKTAFSTGRGLWQFKVMPFGLCNAPATFERLMEQVLAGLPLSIALVYLDDILVPGHSFSHQLSNLRKVFERLRAAKLKLSPKKCLLFRREVKYLGHMVSKNGITPDPDKAEAVMSWPTPMSATEVKSFLGLCSYYRRFIPHFSNIAHPLHQCASTAPFCWTAESEHAFQRLKMSLTQAPVLTYPDPGALFILDTDASGTGIGAVLSQVSCPEHYSDPEQERVVAYYSCTLSRAERQYCVTRKELLAVVKAIKHFHIYLYGRKFLLRTDHSALQWLLSFRQPEGQVARWLERLQQYDFSVEHRAGNRHGNADALSRRPCLLEACKHCDRLDSLEHLGTETNTHSQECQSRSSQVTHVPMVATLSLSSVTGSHEELRHAQLSDADIKPVLKWKECRTDKPGWEEIAPYSHNTKVYVAQWESLKIVNGVLYRLWETPSGDATVKQLVLPKALITEALRQLHNLSTSGHLGVAKTLGRVRERFYWVQCQQDVKDWCRNCDLCAQRRGPKRKTRAPMKKYNVGSPMERVAMDILGPLPISDSGNKYILIVSDYFTRWVEAYAIADQEARTIAEILTKEFICRYGVPLFIHTDQGRNFESSLMAEVCELLDVKKTRTTAYHPQSDGMVERFNQTLEAQLSKFADHNQRDWDQHIPFLLMAYRSAVHDTTGNTPAKMMLGRDLKLPVDLSIGRPEEETFQSAHDYLITMQERLERIHDFAREHQNLMTDRMKQRYDLPLKCPRLKTGDAVWLHNPQRRKGLTPKLQRPWQGPYTVLKRINDLVYRIQLGPSTKPKIVHRNRLWLYSGDNRPSWFQTPCCDVDSSTPESTPPSNDQGCQLLVDHEHESNTLRRSERSRRPPERFEP